MTNSRRSGRDEKLLADAVRIETASKGHRLRDRPGRGFQAMPAISEADWSAQVEGLLDLFGWRWVHFRPGLTRSGRWATALSGCPGFPDYVAVKGDRLLVFELKSDKGKATPDQVAWLADLERAGAGGYIFRPSDFEAVRELLE